MKIKQMVTEVLTASDVVPQLAKYIAQQTGKSEKQILKSITAQTGELKGKQFVRKFFAAEKIEVEEAERAVVGIINTAAKDRDREIVDPDGAVLTDYQRNRVVLYAHDYSGLPVGRNMWIKNKPGVGLIAKTEFAPRPADLPESQPWLADQVYHLMKSGFLNGFSIGFIPLEERELEDAETKSGVERAWSKWLMLEYSIVAVPSNPEAVAMEIKSGAVNHPDLIKGLESNGLEIEIEESEMKTEEPSEETEKTYTISEKLGIWAVKTEDGADCYFDETVWTDEAGTAWAEVHGTKIADLLHDECLRGEDGEIDQKLLDEALKDFLESTSEGEVEIKIEGDEEDDDDPPVNEPPEEKSVNGIPLAVVKTFDLEGNPSVNEIDNAIWRAIDKSSGLEAVGPDEEYLWASSLYPVDYPNGKVVIARERSGVETSYRLYDYTYSDGVATLTDPVEVIRAWREKSNETGQAGEGSGERVPEKKGSAEEGSPESKKTGEVVVKLDASYVDEALKSIREQIAELKEGKVLSKATRPLVEKAVEALKELLEKADARTPEPEVEKEIEIEDPPEEPGITKEQIKELLSTPESIAYIKSEMAKAKGIV